jgi:hypothetical protein
MELQTTNRTRGGQVTHGGTYTREYRVWWDMHQRCSNPKNERYPKYGGRGISVCERWDDFRLFIADMGQRPSCDHSLDRKDNDGNYDPGNCRWATRSEQQRNKGPITKDNCLPRGDAHWTRRDKKRAVAVARKNIQNAHKSGAENGNAKLTREVAESMRQAYTTSPTIDMTDLGKQFGVGRETARKVIRRLAWT